MKRTRKPPPPRPIAPTKKIKPAPGAFDLQKLATLYAGDSPLRDVPSAALPQEEDGAPLESEPGVQLQLESEPLPPQLAVPPPQLAPASTPPPPQPPLQPPVPRPVLYGDDILIPIARLLKQYHARSHLELEAKLGKCNGDSFASGVSELAFSTYLAMLESYHGWALPQWKYSFDYILKNQVRCTKSSAGHAFVRKSLVEHVTLQCKGRPYDVRFSLKEEVPAEIRAPGEPTLIRVKKRKSFVYKDKLQFDLTIVWTGATEQEAHDSEPTFEVELECINKQLLGRDHSYVASSMVEKMLDFIGRDQVTIVRVRGRNESDK